MTIDRKEKFHISSNWLQKSSRKAPKNFVGIFLLITSLCAFLYSCNVSGSDSEKPPSDKNTSPVAELSYSPSNPATGDTVTFDGSSSSDADGEITIYRWDLNGDGNMDESSSSPTTTHVYSNTGEFTVSLEVVDDNEASNEDTVTVSVSSSNSAPSADFTYSPSSPQAGETVTFDASGSSDPDGIISSYMWDYDGDGNFDQTTQTATVNKSYSSGGNYDVTLKVVDDEQASNQITKTISVVGNSAPSADFTYSPSGPQAGETVTFDASGSSDPDGVISSYMWDYDGDGNFDQTTQSATVNKSYSSGGNYDVTLKVVDDEQASNQVTKTISVAGNSAPSADFEYTPSSPSVGEDVTLDASASYDPDGTVVNYSWDFDGDGNYDRTSENPTTVTSYSEAGSYDVKLKIIDDNEVEDTVTKTISVGT